MKSWLFVGAVAIAAAAACSKSNDSKQTDRFERKALNSTSPNAAPSPEMQASVNAAVAGSVRADAISSSRDDALKDASRAAAMPGGADAQAVTDSLVPSMIIRTGQASVFVDTLQPGLDRVRALAHRVGGYVANTQVALGPDQTHTATLKIKLPSSRWDEAVNGLAPIGRVESVNVQTQDVGEEYVDINARATNAHKLEQRLIELLEARTGRLRDVVELESKLAEVREQIERMEGRLRYLKTRAAISTLTITVHEKLPVIEPHGSIAMLGEAFADAWRSFVRMIAGMIASLGVLVPLGVVGLAIFLLVRRYVPRPKPRRSPPSAKDEPPPTIDRAA